MEEEEEDAGFSMPPRGSETVLLLWRIQILVSRQVSLQNMLKPDSVHINFKKRNNDVKNHCLFPRKNVDKKTRFLNYVVVVESLLFKQKKTTAHDTGIILVQFRYRARKL